MIPVFLFVDYSLLVAEALFPLVLYKKKVESQMLHGSRPRAICTPVVAILTVGLHASVCKLAVVCFSVLLNLIHHCLTGHVDPSCRGSQVTMAPACDTAGCV